MSRETPGSHWKLEEVQKGQSESTVLPTCEFSRFHTFVFRTARQDISVAVRHPVCGTLM